MRILALYMSREFLKLMGLFLVSFVGLYTLFDFIEKVDNFQEAGVASATMLSFFVLQIPELVVLLIPVAILMSTILTLGLMAKRNEIVAIKSGGLSIFRFTMPIMLIATVFTLGSALLNETVIPRTKARTNYIWDVMVEKRPGQMLRREKFWLKGDNSIYKVGFYDSTSQTISNVTYYRFDKDFNLALRIDAKRARFLGDQWVFISGMSQERLPGGGYKGEMFEEKLLPLPERPGDFTRLSKPSEEMGLGELVAWLEKMEREGYDARKYRVDLQAKLAFPFVCIIMALWGIPLATFKEKGAALAPGVVLGLGVSLLYWVSFSYLRSLFGYSGVLPPFLAVWLPNGLFSLGGLWFLSSIRQ